MTEQFELEIEPEETAAPDVLSQEMTGGEMVLARALPAGFNLPALLRFLPDIKLKQRATDAAAAALAIDVQAEGGLVAADAALGPLRESVADIERGFKEPTELANQLHKRLTGLRSDFCEAARDAIVTVSRRIYVEKKRQDDIAAEVRRKAQAEADKLAKEDAARAAKQAAEAGAPKAVVQELKQQAKTATAPPVATLAPPALKGTAVVANWKCRLVGTPDDAEPNPETTEMTGPQRTQMLMLLGAILVDPSKLAAVKLDWSYLNKRAAADKTTFDMPGLEAVDVGGTRAKGRR